MTRREFLKSKEVKWDVEVKAGEGEFAELAGSNQARKSIGEKFSPPVGTLFEVLTNKAMPGWLMCDGTYVRAVDYPNLFLYLGDNYGEGYGWDGHSDQFRVPSYISNDISVKQRILIKAS